MTVIRRTRMLAALAVAIGTIGLAGCSGGGGDGDSAADAVPPAAQAGIPPAEGASPELSASQAIAALGAPAAVLPEDVEETLSGYDEFGIPSDVFRQQVRDDPTLGGEEGEPSDGVGGPAEPVGPPPINSDPLVPAPGVPPQPGAATGGDADGPPVESPRALEADFDVSGEPVIAREGDSIPPETQQFEVDQVRADRVVLILVGGLLPDGGNQVTLAVGESITLFNATADRTYRLKLIAIRAA